MSFNSSLDTQTTTSTHPHMDSFEEKTRDQDKAKRPGFFSFLFWQVEKNNPTNKNKTKQVVLVFCSAAIIILTFPSEDDEEIFISYIIIHLPVGFICSLFDHSLSLSLSRERERERKSSQFPCLPVYFFFSKIAVLAHS